jgi:hypothetical protein
MYIASGWCRGATAYGDAHNGQTSTPSPAGNVCDVRIQPPKWPKDKHPAASERSASGGPFVRGSRYRNADPVPGAVLGNKKAHPRIIRMEGFLSRKAIARREQPASKW